MSIIFDEENKLFYIHTKSTTYVLGFMHEYLVHCYWGKSIKKLPCTDFAVPHKSRSQSPYNPEHPECQNDNLPMEYPTFGSSDLRSPAFHVIYADGTSVSDFCYVSHEITAGKPKLEGLPCIRASEDGGETLKICLADEKTGLTLSLLYSVLNDKDIITRSVEVENRGTNDVRIDRILSASVDIYGMDFDFVTLHGTSIRERSVQKNPLFFGSQTIDSKRGYSGHRLNPFACLASKNATETSGEVYAMNFVYSGNFLAGADVDPFKMTRFYMGINPFDFEWKLCPGEKFVSPEVVMVYSDEGYGKMSRTFHDAYRENLCRSKFALKPRPVLINNWETTAMDFDEEKIVDIAKKAAEIGVELMVLDDGWFGNRNSDNCSLGDWYADTNKLPSGLSGLAKKINALGLEFGLWFEPEMVSPDSDLYRMHPDWCIHVPGRIRSEGRNQLILDFANEEVCDYITDAVSKILCEANISYVKWDMNRNMSETGSSALGSDRQRETAHRYMLGLYRVLETLTTQFPDILFESCASGGGRFDAGMLYYMPQVWTSDNSDAGQRMKIQYGTSFAYPASSMGAHVSAVPNHQVFRTTPFKTRCDVAMNGQFGFELDLAKISDEELKLAKEGIEKYKSLRDTVHFGDMYRLMSPFDGNDSVIEYISKDKKQVVVFRGNTLAEPYGAYKFAKLCALEPDAVYEDCEKGISMTGEALMNVGIAFMSPKDFESEIYVFEKK